MADASDEVYAHQGSEGANKVALRRTDPNLHLCHELSRAQASLNRAQSEREIDKKWLKVQTIISHFDFGGFPYLLYFSQIE